MKFHKGFTLIEILISIGIFLMIVSALVVFERDIWRENNFIQGSLITESEARGALKRMIAEIRTAAAGNDGGYAIYSATSSELVIYSDVDKDSVRERVRYFTASSTLRRGVIKPAGPPYVYNAADEKIQTIVKNIVSSSTASVFSYFNSSYDGSSTSTPLALPIDVSAIRVVKITIIANSDVSSDVPQMLFSSQVTIRNLR